MVTSEQRAALDALIDWFSPDGSRGPTVVHEALTALRDAPEPTEEPESVLAVTERKFRSLAIEWAVWAGRLCPEVDPDTTEQRTELARLVALGREKEAAPRSPYWPNSPKQDPVEAVTSRKIRRLEQELEKCEQSRDAWGEIAEEWNSWADELCSEEPQDNAEQRTELARLVALGREADGMLGAGISTALEWIAAQRPEPEAAVVPPEGLSEWKSDPAIRDPWVRWEHSDGESHAAIYSSGELCLVVSDGQVPEWLPSLRARARQVFKEES